jgi:hypothetical protein
MKKETEYSENKILLPFVMATLFAILIISASIMSGAWESQKIIIISSFVWFVWLVFFIMEKIKGNKIAERKSQCMAKLIIASVISLFFANTIWFSGYLTLDPANAILNRTVHADTVLHATIAESIKNYGYPSNLFVGSGVLQYHIGSHFIMALLSKIMTVSVFNAYNFLYPIICIPIYSYLAVAVVIEIRKYKNEKTRISIADYAVLSFFFVGFFPGNILDRIGIWKSSWVVSESFLFALIFFLLYVFLILKISTMRRYRNIAAILLSSLFIFICSSMKISVGFLLATGVIYYNFRENTRKLRYWIANIGFLVVFLVSYKVFTGSVGNHSVGNDDPQMFSFVRHYARSPTLLYGFFFHYFFLLFFTIFFLCYQISANTPLKLAIASKKLLPEETLVVVSVTSLIPGLFFNIVSGSAVYFSYLQELIAICLLLGFNIPGELQQQLQAKTAMLKIYVRVFMLFFLFNVFYNSNPFFSFVKIINIQNNTTHDNLLTNLQDIVKIPENERKKYCIFLEDNADAWDFSEYRLTTPIYFYPALTGIRMLNGVYTNGTDAFLSNGVYLTDVESAYEIITEEIDGERHFITKLNLDEAIEKAKKRNYSYVIYFYEDKYQIIDTGIE